jgi:(2S)-methylsuccinyl-CoA dehydrogenase
VNDAHRRDAGVKLIALSREATRAAEKLLAAALTAVSQRVTVENYLVERLFDREQRATHGLAWLATYVEAIRQLGLYAERIHAGEGVGEVEELLIQIGIGEYLAQMQGGIPMSPGEIVRPSDLGLSYGVFASELAGPLETLMTGNAERRTRLTQLMRAQQGGNPGECGLDETLTSIRDEMRKFAESDVVPHAQQWHRTNSYIPTGIIAQMAELGVFGLTIPEEYGGLSLGKEAMCVVSEELARGYIGVGSLGTRSEIAAELIISSGTEDCQRRSPADGGLHRAQCRVGSRLDQDAGGTPGRRLQSLRQQDLDHPSRSRRSDDALGAHGSARAGPSRALDAARGETARHGRASVPGGRDVRHRDRGARVSGDEGV